MNSKAAQFWNWFTGFAKRACGESPSEQLQDELLSEIHHRLDERIYFEMSTNSSQKELILTACGDESAFPIIVAIVNAAPKLAGWSFIALKPAQGVSFTHQDGEIELNAAELWFMPLKSKINPTQNGIRLGIPNADAVKMQQSVDTAYTILETVIGERLCATSIHHVEMCELPAEPTAAGYLRLSQLAEYLNWRATKQRH